MILQGYPQCRGFLTVDGFERDGTLCCLSCGNVELPERVKATSAFCAEQVALKHRRHHDTAHLPPIPLTTYPQKTPRIGL